MFLLILKCNGKNFWSEVSALFWNFNFNFVGWWRFPIHYFEIVCNNMLIFFFISNNMLIGWRIELQYSCNLLPFSCCLVNYTFMVIFGIIQIDVDIGSSSVARSVIGLVLGYVTSLVVDLAILIQVCAFLFIKFLDKLSSYSVIFLCSFWCRL